MSPPQAVALAVRLFALWLAIYWARWIPHLYTQAHEADDPTASVVVAIVVTVLTILFVLLLWFFPRTVARTVLPEESPMPIANASPDTWFAVGCALLGLWVFTDAVPGLVQNMYVLNYVQRARFPEASAWDGATVYYIVELAIGIWLLLGASGARKIVWWARNVGAQ